MEPNMEQRKITQGDLVSMFLRSNLQQASFNFERIHGLGFCYDMIPAIKRLYPLKEDQVAALKRHLVFFNTTPAVCGPVIGVTAAMEEARANGAAIDDGAINGIKVGLMGPLAGVGDPLVWGTLRPITAALGASLALSGNILGPLLFFFIFNAVRLAMKWYGLQLGFRKGVNIVSDMGGNLLQKLTEGASILGLFVMGVLVTKWTTINVPLVVSQTPGADGSTVTMTVQNILDQLCPGLLALGLTLLMVRLLNKKVNPVWLIFALFGLGISVTRWASCPDYSAPAMPGLLQQVSPNRFRSRPNAKDEGDEVVNMQTTALRLYGKRDLRLETFELPAMQDDEILARVVTDSLCLSSWKEANQGEDHKKVPDDVATNPIIIGHEFCGEIIAVGKKWQHKFRAGQRYVIQANLQLPDRPDCPGYSFPWIGGEATHVVIPNEVMEQDCLLSWEGDTWFEGSLVEPLSCVIGAFNANYHLQEGSYNHVMGIRPQGRTLILGGTGPMGLLAIDYALHGPINPALLVVTDTNKPKLSYARQHYPSEPQTLIHYLDGRDASRETLMALSGGHGFDDIFVFVPNEQLITLASSLLAADGCLNFFAGPQDKQFSAPINFYDVHYAFTHYVGTSGGNTDDMRAAVALMQAKKCRPRRW
jgi:mannose/fructose/sorbose-specific phosphotransferase system IID component